MARARKTETDTAQAPPRRSRLHQPERWFLTVHQDFRRKVCEVLDVASEDIDVQNILVKAVAVRYGHSDDPAAFFEDHAFELVELAKLWRVARAEVNLDGLWKAIDNDAPHARFREQFDAWESEGRDAAERAVAQWA